MAPQREHRRDRQQQRHLPEGVDAHERGQSRGGTGGEGEPPGGLAGGVRPDGVHQQRGRGGDQEHRERLGVRRAGGVQHGLGDGERAGRQGRPPRTDQPRGEPGDGEQGQRGGDRGRDEQAGPAAGPPAEGEERGGADEELREQVGRRTGGAGSAVDDLVERRAVQPERRVGEGGGAAERVEVGVDRQAVAARDPLRVEGVRAGVAAQDDVLGVGQRGPDAVPGGDCEAGQRGGDREGWRGDVPDQPHSRRAGGDEERERDRGVPAAERDEDRGEQGAGDDDETGPGPRAEDHEAGPALPATHRPSLVHERRRYTRGPGRRTAGERGRGRRARPTRAST